MIFSTCCKRQVELVVWDISYFPKNMFLTLSVKLPLPYTMFLNIGACHKQFSFLMQSSYQARSSNVVMLFQSPKPLWRLVTKSSWLGEEQGWGWSCSSIEANFTAFLRYRNQMKMLYFPFQTEIGEKIWINWVQSHNEVWMNSFRGTSLWVCLD